VKLKAFPLKAVGNGWSEPQDPDPDVRYAAYRVECRDSNCPAATGPGLIAISKHSHIYIDEGFTAS
jgi:hypothetical protein